MTRWNVSRLLILVLLAGLIVTACASPATDPQAVTAIRLPMGYIPNIQFAPFYASASGEESFYKEAGIEVTFDYSFETDGIALVGSGELPFTLASAEQVLLARAQGLPVVYVAAWYKDFPVAVTALASSGIDSVDDLAGRKVGLPGLFGASYVGLRALLNANNLTESDVELVSIGFNQVEALTQNQVDVVVVYTSNEPVQLAALGYEIVTFPVSDYVSLASNGLVTNEQTIQQNPDLVRRMVAATLRGVRFSSVYPSRAYNHTTAFVENLGPENEGVQRQILDASIALWALEPLGVSDLQAWENMQATLLDMGLLTAPLDLSQAFTNEFLPE